MKQDIKLMDCSNLEIRVYDKKNKKMRSCSVKGDMTADELLQLIKNKLKLG